MRIYVATKFEQKNLARWTMEALRQDGHEITHDWTHEEIPARIMNDEIARNSFLRDCAIGDLMGVLEAEAVLVRAWPGMQGAWFELGIACGFNAAGLRTPNFKPKRMIIVDTKQHAPNFIFQHLDGVDYFTSFDAARAALRGK